MRLRPQGVDESGLLRLAAFLRIGSTELRHRWQVAAEGDFDALLIGDDETLPMAETHGQGGGVVKLRLVEARCFEGEPGQLRHPLAFEELMAQLLWAERCLAGAEAQAIVTNVSTERNDAPVVDAPAPPASEPALKPGEVYHLDHLPASGVIGNDRRVLVVASLLTVRAVALDELVVQSGLSEPDCESALIRLKSLGVLKAMVATPAPPRDRSRSSGVRRSVAAVEATSVETGGGVIARLRGRFGWR